MSNSRKPRQAKTRATRCLACNGKKVKTTEYDDATLFVCQSCGYPWRVVKES